MAQTFAIRTINPVNISPEQTSAIIARIQEVSIKYAQTVDRTTGFLDILKEWALKMSGATTSPDDNLALTAATHIISGSAGQAGPTTWFIDLTLTDVKTGQVLASKSATVSSYKELLPITPIVTKALLTGTNVEDDTRVTVTPDNQPIIIGTNKTIIETHVYQHAPKTHNKKQFIPCNFCQGTGEIPCRGNKVCPSGHEDCPYCSAYPKYQGPNTHGMPMTGHWEK
jgi:hypothetical protein